jgi:RNA polymerase sigma-70 factor (ECF subfamily)
LPARYRVVVALCYFEGLSYKEIAATLDISVAAVEMRLRRARQMLRKHMENQKLEIW